MVEKIFASTSNNDYHFLNANMSTETEASLRKRTFDETSAASSAPDETDHQLTRSVTPSHINPDGTGVILAKPSQKQRNLIFEQSLARHGLLQQNLRGKKTKLRDEAKDVETVGDDVASVAGSVEPDENASKQKKASDTPQIHPLAMASAVLQTEAIQEVNRAINLCSLYPEYFDMSNIVVVDTTTATAPSNEAPDKSQGTTNDTTASSSTKTTTKPSPAASASASNMQQEQRVKTLYSLHRKRAQFQAASKTLQRHFRRLELAVASQTRPDERLLELRKQQWRLVAPEHASRAQPHAVRPIETIACDVDLYAVAATQSNNQQQQQGNLLAATSSVLGQQAKRLPRLATIELKQEYDAKQDVKEWRKRVESIANDNMDVDDNDEEMMQQTSLKEQEEKHKLWTVAEPFAVYNPDLGKLDVDFDPKKSAMLSLQFDIEKPSTGFRQSAQLPPLSVTDDDDDDDAGNKNGQAQHDEKVLASLQHSLLCATLFESIRRELAPDTEEIGNVRTSKTLSNVWLSSESETNFLPPPSLMSGATMGDLAPICVIHCHEGEVKVQLDCEYTLTVKLVEAGNVTAANDDCLAIHNDNAMEIDETQLPLKCSSGSQSAAQLLIFCRILLIDAQERFHKHSIRMAKKRKQRETSQTAGTHARKHVETSPCILQHCCALGSKLLLEQRIRATIRSVNVWLQPKTDDRLRTEWLSLSVFDLQAQFTISFQSWVIDCLLSGEELTVTSMSIDTGAYKKVKFHSDVEFGLFLQMALQRLIDQKAE
ncbi:hypothetical protein MPSEU_000958400 [Mayamaea pseudoterrestris]|nr:hypothetical protein MPSEU_000958400 [Mayamaea pseudoterrestris]